jgi:hypothetical protein
MHKTYTSEIIAVCYNFYETERDFKHKFRNKSKHNKLRTRVNWEGGGCIFR